jgi:hypothetical protein
VRSTDLPELAIPLEFEGMAWSLAYLIKDLGARTGATFGLVNPGNFAEISYDAGYQVALGSVSRSYFLPDWFLPSEGRRVLAGALEFLYSPILLNNAGPPEISELPSLGVWRTPGHGGLTAELSVCVPNFRAAESLARTLNQHSVWAWRTEREIPINYRAERFLGPARRIVVK